MKICRVSGKSVSKRQVEQNLILHTRDIYFPPRCDIRIFYVIRPCRDKRRLYQRAVVHRSKSGFFIIILIILFPEFQSTGDDEIIRERTIVRTEIAPIKECFIAPEVTSHKGLYSFFRTYCCYCRPSRLKAPGTRDYKFGSGNSPAIRTHNGMNIPRRSTLRSQFYPVTLKRSYSLGEIHLAALFLSPPFFSTSFLNRYLLPRAGDPLFARRALIGPRLFLILLRKSPMKTRA